MLTNKRFFYSILFFMVSFIGCTLAAKSVTFLVYMAADNNLSSYVQGDLDEMMKVGSNENITILVYLNTRLEDGRKISRKLIIYKGFIKQQGPDEMHDSGDPETLYIACKWAATSFPADHFVLDMWNHGSGGLNKGGLVAADNLQWWWPMAKKMRAVCYDDTTGNFLTDKGLQTTLSRFCKDFWHGKKIDILAFDACLMADIEVAYTVAPYVQYMVASQETIPGSGYGYDYALTQAAAGQIDAKTFARNMVYAYEKEYKGSVDSYTLTALDLSRMLNLVVHTNTVSQLLINLLKGSDRRLVKVAIAGSANGISCTSFYDSQYIDLIHFYTNLYNLVAPLPLKNNTEKAQLLKALTDATGEIKNVVIANVNGSKYPKAHGLSIYFDQAGIDSTYGQLIWSQSTKWHSFLQTYFAKNMA